MVRVAGVLYAMLYVHASCCVVRGCAVSGTYINVCNIYMFCVVNVYLDYLKFCVVCINGHRYDCCSECNVVSNECSEPTSCLVQPISMHGGEVMYFGCVCFRGELFFQNYDAICMCVVNKQFELLEFFVISFILTCSMMSVSLCCVCSHVVVFGLSVRLSWYSMWMRWLL